MLYKEEEIKKDEYLNDFLTTNAGFLKRLPSNVPISVKVRLYVVKVELAFSSSLVENKNLFEIHLDYGKSPVKLKEISVNKQTQGLVGEWVNLILTNLKQQIIYFIHIFKDFMSLLLIFQMKVN